MKKNWHRILLIALSITATLLLIISWIAPPPWEIHPTVIQAVAEIFAFAALSQVIPAIESGKSVKIQKGETSIEIESRE